MAASYERPLTVAIMALGGQGGGVLTKWLVDIAQANGYLAQSTYVAGVAQRTGATVYCVEIFPQAQALEAGREPVFTTYPVPGDVDLVVAGEFAETGRAIQKGFVTPNITTLIASTHRVYSIIEKSALGDGIIDQQPVINAAQRAARRFIAFDMAEKADESGSIISAVLLGSIAASGALPFDRDTYEQAIRKDGRAVASNLAGFDAGFAGVGESVGTDDGTSTDNGSVIPLKTLDPKRAQGPSVPEPEGPNGQALLERIRREFPQAVHTMAGHGALRTLDYQDSDYAGLYLDRLAGIAELESNSEGRGCALTNEVARQLALQMCYEDTIRVAEIKTSGQRMEKVRQQLNVAEQQPAEVVEYFHPRFEELCDTLPRGIGGKLLGFKTARHWFRPILGKGRNITTTHIMGYLQLAMLARLRRWRRGTYRFYTQSRLIDDWLGRILKAADDYDLALAIAECIGMVRGYGETYERGLDRYQIIMSKTEIMRSGDKAARVRALQQAAMADEAGNVFQQSLQTTEEL